MFKKIFDLDPKEVENFVRDLVKEQVKRNLDKDDISDWLKDYSIEVRWLPVESEFYVQIEPHLETKDYKRFYFKSDKELTAGEYFKLAFEHYHFYFAEIYGLITGETVCYTDTDTGVPGQEGYYFIHKGERRTVVKVISENKYYILNWDEATRKDVLAPLPDSLAKKVDKCVAEFER